MRRYNSNGEACHSAATVVYASNKTDEVVHERGNGYHEWGLKCTTGEDKVTSVYGACNIGAQPEIGGVPTGQVQDEWGAKMRCGAAKGEVSCKRDNSRNE